MSIEVFCFFVFNFLGHFEFHLQVVERIFGPRTSSKSVLTFTKVHIVGANQFVQSCCSVVGHFRFNFVVWRNGKENKFILERRVKKCLLAKNKLVLIINLIGHDILSLELFHLSDIPTISVDWQCMTSTFP